MYIVLDLRLVSFYLGLYFSEIFNLDVQLNKNQSGFINQLYLMWAKVCGSTTVFRTFVTLGF